MKNKIDYTKKYECNVLSCWPRYKDKFLILKRGEKVLAYQNMWSNIGGFLDDDKSIEDKVKEEVFEETGLGGENIIKIIIGEKYELVDKKLNRKWITTPVLCQVNSDKIKLDWEHTEYKWVRPDEIKDYEMVKNSLVAFGKLIKNK